MDHQLMPNCQQIEPTLAAYAEGACAPAEGSRVEAHLQACPACRARVAAERTACELLRARRRELRGLAPEGLRLRCAAQRRTAPPVPASRRTWVPLSFAASLVFAAGLLMFGLGGSVETYAAGLAVDHLKCFQFPPQGNGGDAAVMGDRWRAANGWPLRIAPSAKAEGLELIGIRRCGSTKGRVAHLLYRWRGEPLSVYVLNSRVEGVDEMVDPKGHDADDHGGEAHAAIRTLGAQELMWSDRERTYAVVAQAPASELQQVARYVRRLTY